ncbi:hypothetical protein [Nakamurella flavida]|nr:hypothetical protein [Nakamurella flavida]
MALGAVAVLVLLVWDLWRGRGGFAGMWLIYFAGLWIYAQRSPTVVDAAGIRRPWRLRRSVTWAEVDAVAAPQLGVEQVRLVLTTGRTLTLDDIPAEHAAEVAALGGKELRRPVPLSLPRPAPREPTDAQRAADLDRRARALADQRAELDAQAQLRPRGIPRRPPPS